MSNWTTAGGLLGGIGVFLPGLFPLGLVLIRSNACPYSARGVPLRGGSGTGYEGRGRSTRNSPAGTDRSGGSFLAQVARLFARVDLEGNLEYAADVEPSLQSLE